MATIQVGNILEFEDPSKQYLLTRAGPNNITKASTKNFVKLPSLTSGTLLSKVPKQNRENESEQT